MLYRGKGFLKKWAPVLQHELWTFTSTFDVGVFFSDKCDIILKGGILENLYCILY